MFKEKQYAIVSFRGIAIIIVLANIINIYYEEPMKIKIRKILK